VSAGDLHRLDVAGELDVFHARILDAARGRRQRGQRITSYWSGGCW